jgi:two-component system, LytTR family, response regulator
MRVLVVDDELQARKRVARLLESLPDVEVVGSCESATEALAVVARDRPDVVVLDISMPGLSGLEARSRLPADGPAVIFVTAHAEHAVEAFEVGAVDYVLKPVTAARLAKALARVRPPVTPARLPIETRTGTILVEPVTIAYAQFDGALVTLASASEQWVTTMSLADLEARLGPAFVRVDRRHLVNVAEIARLEPSSTGGAIAVTRAGARIPVSRQARRSLGKRLGL